MSAYLVAAAAVGVVTISALAACGDDASDRVTLSPSTEDPDRTLREQLGCGPVFHYYDNEADNGFRSGLGSFCPDTPETRAVLHAHGKSGFACDTSDACAILPAQEVLAFWRHDLRAYPGCTSGCVPGYEPIPF